jgi:hypothetical protein
LEEDVESIREVDELLGVEFGQGSQFRDQFGRVLVLEAGHGQLEQQGDPAGEVNEFLVDALVVFHSNNQK